VNKTRIRDKKTISIISFVLFIISGTSLILSLKRCMVGRKRKESLPPYTPLQEKEGC